MGISAKRYARAAELSECARPKLCRAAAKGKACCLSLDSEKAHLHGAEAICDRLPALQRQRRGVALFDEGEVATMMMARPVMKATHIFDLIQEPGYEHTVQNLGELLKHFSLHLCAFVS